MRYFQEIICNLYLFCLIFFDGRVGVLIAIFLLDDLVYIFFLLNGWNLRLQAGYCDLVYTIWNTTELNYTDDKDKVGGRY